MRHEVRVSLARVCVRFPPPHSLGRKYRLRLCAPTLPGPCKTRGTRTPARARAQLQTLTHYRLYAAGAAQRNT